NAWTFQQDVGFEPRLIVWWKDATPLPTSEDQLPAHATREDEPMLRMPVLLHVYDCGQALTQVGIGGAYHASVEVNGLEWDVGGYNRNVWSSSTCFVKGTGLAEDGCKRELITRLVLATAPDLRPLIRWASLQVFGPSELQRKKVEAVVSDPVEEVTSYSPGCKGCAGGGIKGAPALATAMAGKTDLRPVEAVVSDPVEEVEAVVSPVEELSRCALAGPHWPCAAQPAQPERDAGGACFHCATAVQQAIGHTALLGRVWAGGWLPGS
ncbi:unnamed protein product, partial [Symbiodinium sp. KB8]